MKKTCAMLLILMLLSSSALCEELSVVTTSFPCYDFVRQIAGGAEDVQMLLKPGAEVHSFEPTPSDIRIIGEADLFVYIGGESDVWVDGMLDSYGADGPDRLKLMDAVTPLEEASDEHMHEAAHAHEMDEHIWTSPKNAVKMLRAIEAELCRVAPASAEVFHQNAEAYIAQVEQIDRDLEQIVSGGKRKKLIFADRFPFLYLAHDYGLSYSAAFLSCSAESEPSAQTVIRLIEEIVSENIPVVYTIEMSTGAIAKTIAEETGVDTLTLHSIQTVSQQEMDAGETYVSLMRKNLIAIQRGLN